MAKWSKANRIGLVMTMIIGVVNIVIGGVNLPSILNRSPAAGEGPPGGILLLDLVLGVVILGGAAFAWATVSRRGATIASVANILQGLTVIPAFLTDAPLGWQLVAGAVVVWTTVSVALTLSKSRGSAPVE